MPTYRTGVGVFAIQTFRTQPSGGAADIAGANFGAHRPALLIAEDPQARRLRVLFMLPLADVTAVPGRVFIGAGPIDGLRSALQPGAAEMTGG